MRIGGRVIAEQRRRRRERRLAFRRRICFRPGSGDHSIASVGSDPLSISSVASNGTGVKAKLLRRKSSKDDKSLNDDCAEHEQQWEEDHIEKALFIAMRIRIGALQQYLSDESRAENSEQDNPNRGGEDRLATRQIVEDLQVQGRCHPSNCLPGDVRTRRGT